MSDIHHLPNAEEAERQASEWIARLQGDDVSADDRARFAQWRGAHPRNARAYDDLMATWRQLAAVGKTVRAVSFGNAMQAASRVKRPRHGLFFTAMAAMLAFVMVGGWWQSRSPSSFRTGIGEHVSVVLPDGSRVELNSDSAVQVSYDEGTRVIRLERGEAFFTVAHDTARPFWVVAGRTWVRAVGTAFNVDRRQDEVRVTVSEGRVKVATAAPIQRRSPSDDALAQLSVSLLAAGQQADVSDADTQVRRLPPPEMERETSWRNGTVYFENRPLHEVVDEMKRYTLLQIELGATVRDLPVGGTFQTNPQGAEALLSMLHDGFGLQVRREDGQRVRVE
jgi:transmembrane sensor